MAERVRLSSTAARDTLGLDPGGRMTHTVSLLTTLLLVLASLPATAADLKSTLEQRLAGAWTILSVEIWSNCSGGYSDNRIGAGGVASNAGRRFEPGELAKIDRVKVKRSRVDLLVTLAVPILESRTDGPFTLYDERVCKAQLIFELPREVIKTKDAEAVMTAVRTALDAHPSRQAAVGSGDWNGRERRAYPHDYEATLARYENWKAEQNNLAVSAAIEQSVRRAAEATNDMEKNDDYLAGFAAGAERMHDFGLSSCSTLISASFTSWRKRPPADRSGAWKRGFEDGQLVVFYIRLADDLGNCFVPVPPTELP
jgi:hypothetical protein